MPKARRARQGLAQTKSQGEHLLHAESALYRAGIPHLLIPFQRDKFASNVFVVPSVPDAQHALIRAGFRHSNNAPSLLIDLETGSPIQVVEHTVAERICHAPELRFIHTDNAGVTHLTYL